MRQVLGLSQTVEFGEDVFWDLQRGSRDVLAQVGYGRCAGDEEDVG